MTEQCEILTQVVGLLREALQLFPVGCDGLKDDLRWVLEEAEDRLDGLMSDDTAVHEMYV